MVCVRCVCDMVVYMMVWCISNMCGVCNVCVMYASSVCVVRVVYVLWY